MSFANYLVQVNIYLVIYFLFYKLFLSGETFFSFNRWFLLGSLLTSLLLPFLKITRWATETVHYPARQLTFVLDEVTIRSSPTTAQGGSAWSLFTILAVVYLAGVFISILILAGNLLRIYRLIIKNSGSRNKGYRHIVLPDRDEAFSFWHFLFTGRQTSRQILLHEMTHIRQKHSVDILFLELVKAFCWFNPAIYLYKKNLATVHEYIADEAAARECSKYEYATLLVSRSLGVHENVLLQPFFRPSVLKQRLMMLQRSKSRKAAIWKYALSLPLIGGLIFISSTTFALKNKVSSGITRIQSVKLANITVNIPSAANAYDAGRVIKLSVADSQVHRPADNKSVKVQGTIRDENGEALPGVSVLVPGTVMGTTSDRNGHYSLSGIQPGTILEFRMLGFATRYVAAEGRKSLDVTLHRNTAKLNAVTVTGYTTPPPPPAPQRRPLSGGDNGGSKVFTWVEQMPRYPGAITEMAARDSILNFLHRNIRYPAEARDSGQQGTVYVQFIVEANGSLTHFKVVNANYVAKSLAKEALRVMKVMPKWIPGRQNGRPVTVQFAIPVRFMLQ